MTVTDQDMRLYVVQSLGSDVARYDIDAIVDHLQGVCGTVDLSTVERDTYWRIVLQHEQTTRDDEVKTPTADEEAQYRRQWDRLLANARYGKRSTQTALSDLLDSLLPETRLNKVIATDSVTALLVADIVTAFVASRNPVDETVLMNSMRRIYERFEHNGPQMCAALTKLAANFAELGSL